MNELVFDVKRWWRRKKIIWSKFEYWPITFANAPVFLCYLYYIIRTRQVAFFRYTNPGVLFGGAFGVSKMEMLKDIPQELLPKTILLKKGMSFDKVLEELNDNTLDFPVIVKPDVGERGFFVKKIESSIELEKTFHSLPCDMIAQEFLSQPEEYTLSFHHYPGDPSSFTITSVCKKQFLKISGDGKHSIRELMEMTPRYFLQLDRFEKLKVVWLNTILKDGEEFYPEPIGNHSRGTMFLDARHLITDELIQKYKNICLDLTGIFLGRFDLKAHSEADFRNSNVKIMELNGVFGEPVHMYDPEYTALKAYKDIFTQWRHIYKISRINFKIRKDGFPWQDQWRILFNYFRHMGELKKYN